jgi:hypothetical protein
MEEEPTRRRLGSKLSLSAFQEWDRFRNIMGDYKGRVKLRQRKRRFAKNQRIKALAVTKKGTTPTQGAPNKDVEVGL